MSDVGEELQTLLADPEAPGRRWKAEDGQVIGYLGAAAPVEIIAASGALPVRLRGDAAVGTALADEWMEPVQEGALRTIFERLLSGAYAWLDAIVVPRSSEQLLQFYHLAEHVRASVSNNPLPPIHLFNLLQTPESRSTRFNRIEMERLRQALATLTGSTMEDDAIRAAVSAANDLRRRVTSLAVARRADGPAVSGSGILSLSVAGQGMPGDAFGALLNRADDLARPQSGPRILLAGSSQDNAGLTIAIEATGARIVAEDHDWGERAWSHEVAETPDPLDGLVEHYQLHAPTPRLPVDAEEARFAAVLKDARPDGVILALEANDDTIGWDVPRRVKAAEARGIPTLILTRLSFFEEDPQTTGRLDTFIRSLNEAPR